MPARFPSDALSGVPGRLNGQALGRFFIFSGADLIAVGRRHGDVNRVGRVLQLCRPRMLGFCPDDVTAPPEGA
jgi:Domain of unknown function (DUF4158)